MKIDHYQFGQIIIEGKEFHQDLIIFPKRIFCPWWRLEGHNLRIEDLREVWKENPDFLVIGTGAYAFMKVKEEVKKKALELGIKLVIQPTAQAVESYNQKSTEGKTVGAFHLTC